jgi:hypothetical protein
MISTGMVVVVAAAALWRGSEVVLVLNNFMG